jgi:hypothetical protein
LNKKLLGSTHENCPCDRRSLSWRRVAAVRADDAACQAVLAAIAKQTTVPTHQKIAMEVADAPGKPILSETIHVGDMFYRQDHGEWTSTPYDAAKQAEQVRQALKKTEHSCTRLRSEVVGSKPAELYGVQTKMPSGGSETQIWISAATGLPLRQLTMMEQGTTRVKHEVNFDYDNVKAP